MMKNTMDSVNVLVEISTFKIFSRTFTLDLTIKYLGIENVLSSAPYYDILT